MRRSLSSWARSAHIRANRGEAGSASRPSWLRYGVAVLAIGVALLAKLLLDPLITEQSPFLLLAGAVMIGAWFGGLGPGMLATALGTVGADYFFLAPVGSFTGPGVTFLPLFLFMAQGVLISSLAAALRSAKARAVASEERFRLLVQVVEDYAIFMLDPQGRVASWNEGAERINGYKAEEIMGKHFSIFYTEGDLKRGHPQEELRLAEERGRYEEEGLRVRKDGSRFWANVLITALRDEDGTLRGFSKVVRDTTERRRAEKALQRSERSLAVAQRIANMGNFEYDVARDQAYWSEELYRIFGYAPELFVPRYRTFLKRVHPDDQNSLRRAIRQALRGDGARTIQYRIVRSDGEVRYVESQYKVSRDGDKPKAIIGTVQDITERKQAEEALKQSEELYRSVVEQAAENIFLVDVKTRHILEANAAFYDSLGYAPEELEEMTLYDIVAHDRQSIDHNVKNILQEGRRYIGERKYRRKDGTLMDVEVSTSAISYSGREILCVVAHDITERKMAEKKLHELVRRILTAQEEERRRVAYDIHDGFTQMAATAYRRLQTFMDHRPPQAAQDRQELEDTVALVQRTVGEARRIISNLRPTTLDDFGLATALRMEVEEFRSEGFDATYEETLGEERLPAMLETALFRVAQEAVANVRKHAQTDRVRVALGRHDRFVRLEVRDWGRGFEPAELGAGGGPGERVGLSSMRERIVLLGGNLEIRSEPGAGTSVVAKVPLLATTGEQKVDDGK